MNAGAVIQLRSSRRDMSAMGTHNPADRGPAACNLAAVQRDSCKSPSLKQIDVNDGHTTSARFGIDFECNLRSK